MVEFRTIPIEEVRRRKIKKSRKLIREIKASLATSKRVENYFLLHGKGGVYRAHRVGSRFEIRFHRESPPGVFDPFGVPIAPARYRSVKQALRALKGY